MAEGTGCITTSKAVTIFWDQWKYTKTIYLDLKLNIAMTRTLSGSKAFRAYMANHQESCDNIHVFKTHIILDENSISEEDDNISLQSTDQIEYSQEPTQIKQSDNSQEC